MELGMIGLGRMGGNMVRRLLRDGHRCVVHDRSPEAVKTLESEGAAGAGDLATFVRTLTAPRAIWIMVPAAAVDSALAELMPLLSAGDVVIDGGNSNFQDDQVRARRLGERGIHYVDCGVSGGVWGLERGYCLMIGGEAEVVRHLEPVFATLAPGRGDIPATEGRPANSTADQGYLHCGPSGAGHFVKMVHNAIEYGMMAAYAEGFSVLEHAGAGKESRAVDAETTPLRHPEHYRYEFDLGEIAELWRRGSVIPSWLLDLCAAALAGDPELDAYSGRVSDSGEGRWTLAAANDLSVPAPILASALFARFTSRGEADFQNRMLSALRHQFGGHKEKPH